MAGQGRGNTVARRADTPSGGTDTVNGAGTDEHDEPGARTIGARVVQRWARDGGGVMDDTPLHGPYDEDDLDPEQTSAGLVDFGAVRVPVPPDGQVMVEPDDGRLQAVHVMLPAGRLSVSALAAPRTGRLWPDLAAEIDESLRQGGASVRSFTGEWGRELHARTGEASSVFVGVDGARWMLYGVATGPTSTGAELDGELRRMLRGTVVVRGRSPYPVRTVLPLTVPEGLAAAMPELLEPAPETVEQERPEARSGSWRLRRGRPNRNGGRGRFRGVPEPAPPFVDVDGMPVDETSAVGPGPSVEAPSTTPRGLPRVPSARNGHSDDRRARNGSAGRPDARNGHRARSRADDGAPAPHNGSPTRHNGHVDAPAAAYGPNGGPYVESDDTTVAPDPSGGTGSWLTGRWRKAERKAPVAPARRPQLRVADLVAEAQRERAATEAPRPPAPAELTGPVPPAAGMTAPRDRFRNGRRRGPERARHGHGAVASPSRGLPAVPSPPRGLPALPSPPRGVPAIPSPPRGASVVSTPARGVPAVPSPARGLPALPSPSRGVPAVPSPRRGVPAVPDDRPGSSYRQERLTGSGDTWSARSSGAARDMGDTWVHPRPESRPAAPPPPAGSEDWTVPLPVVRPDSPPPWSGPPRLEQGRGGPAPSRRTAGPEPSHDRPSRIEPPRAPRSEDRWSEWSDGRRASGASADRHRSPREPAPGSGLPARRVPPPTGSVRGRRPADRRLFDGIPPGRHHRT